MRNETWVEVVESDWEGVQRLAGVMKWLLGLCKEGRDYEEKRFPGMGVD